MGSSVPYNTQQQQQQQQQRRQQQQQANQDSSSSWQQSSPQQHARNSSSGSNSSSSSYWSRPSSSSSSAAAPNEVLSSAIDKLYKQRLREVKAMLASSSMEELQRDLTPEQQESLQVVLQDLQVIAHCWL
jgi:hypothetical protein